MTQIRHFEIELSELRRSLMNMGSLVERSLAIAVEAINRPTVEAREQARAVEDQLDAMESAIEERCHQIIALQQPLAKDLRLVISAMRITADLEQVGDLAESIAKRASAIARSGGQVRNPEALPTLGRLVTTMVFQCLDAFVRGDIDIARNLIAEERQSDDLTKQCYEEIQGRMQEEHARIREYTHLLRAVALLEQIADIAVSIAEEAVYIHQGRNIRHHHSEIL